jgi:hypothetical protein
VAADTGGVETQMRSESSERTRERDMRRASQMGARARNGRARRRPPATPADTRDDVHAAVTKLSNMNENPSQIRGL